MKKRILFFDIARTLCVLYIVGFWHMLDYYQLSNEFVNCNFITTGVLSCFTFLSGLFLGKKNISIKEFYVSRFKRFALLLYVSAISFYVVGYIDDVSTLIGTITGLSCFGLPWARTLWYFSMMILFYLMTPFLLYKIEYNKSRTVPIVSRGILIYLSLLLVSIISPPIR